MRQLSTYLILALILTACGDDETGPTGPTFADKLCETGEKSCFGNSAATCSDDGQAWTLNYCGLTKICEAGSCAKDRECPFPGLAKCKDGAVNILNVCNATGTALTEQTCDPGTGCFAGACRTIPCTDGETACGWRSAATCSAGNWIATACDANETCQDGACVPEVCKPESLACKNENTAQTCKVDGSGYAESACAENEICYEQYGFCTPKLAEEPTEITDDIVEPDAEDGEVVDDAGPIEDKGPPAELEPLDLAEAVIDGEKVVFKSHKTASYVETDSDLRITMDQGSQKIEISIKPIDEFDVGEFSSQTPSDVNVIIFYDDGTAGRTGGAFNYQSVDYEVELIKFQSNHGRVKGTFSGTLTPDGGQTTIPVENGNFDVKRHD